MNELTDEKLVKLSQKGDMTAFEKLLEKYDDRVLGIAASFRNGSDDAKDIYQEVFIRVYKGLKNFKYKSSFSTWLYRITTNVCITHRERKARNTHDSLNSEVTNEEDSETTFSEMLEADEDTNALIDGADIGNHINKAMDKLPAKQRMAFTLKYYEGYKIREIAGMMNTAEGTIKRYLFTAANKMKDELKFLTEV